MNDKLNIKGHVIAVLYDSNGRIKDSLEADNLVVNVGKDWIIDRAGASTTATASWINIGSSDTAANAADTNVGTTLAGANGAITQPSSTTHQVVATFGAGTGTGTVKEYGLFASGSAMVGHIVTGSISKTASDSLQVTYQLTVS